MILVKPSFEIISYMGENEDGQGFSAINLIELAGRTCYKSPSPLTEATSKQFCQKLTLLGHESVLEHSAVTVKFIVDRGVSHELVRHRLCTFSQESTRYCNYKGGVTFVIPPWCRIKEGEYTLSDVAGRFIGSLGTWLSALVNDELNYQDLLGNGWSPQQARSVLPNSLKTEIVVTTNFREWKHILKLRTSKAAHPQMREIMIPLLHKFKETFPVIFDSIEEETTHD